MASDNNQPTDSDMGIFDDPSFNNANYDSYSNFDSPFDASRFFTLGADSPDYNPRTPSKSFLDQDPASAPHTLQQQQQPQHPRSLLSSRSAESSSQDSSSESSVRRKRKTTSESPPTENFAGLKMDPASRGLDMYGRPTNMAGLGQDMLDDDMDMNSAFDFTSAASSPGGMNATIAPFRSMQNPMLHSGAPPGTIEPAQFFMGSTGASPTSAGTTTGEGSPAVFPDTASGPPDMFSKANMWSASGQPSSWPKDFTESYTSPGNLGLTPSPVTRSRTPAVQHAIKSEGDLIPLHIGAIPAKSRVETQINIRMTIDRLPPGISNLHLPTHTIAKAKLLNKDVPSPETTLELHTMLVCTSAMANDQNMQNALMKATLHDNREIQARGIARNARRENGKKEEVEPDLSEEDKPSNGGEVRICQNCINRERKRAARKKLKKEEEQAHWERYETERAIVFNTNEYKAWLEWQQSPPPKDGSISPAASDLKAPTDSAMQISAPMRIACYCRHHNEKDGFQVIFTLKDWRGKVVAQAISDSILITDDHKTHPMSAVTGQVWYDGQLSSSNGYNSKSMVDLPSHANHMPMSKSTGNLSSMATMRQNSYSGSSIHQMPGFSSQTTSGSMTPRNLSRPASPTVLNQAGPAKKRKSSSAHRRVPSGLTMTKVETNQSKSSNPQFSPNAIQAMTPDSNAFMGMNNGRSRQPFNQQSNMASDNQQFFREQLSRTTSLDQPGFQAFYSTPNSAHQSRANSPTLHGPNLAALQRQQSRPNQFNMGGQTASITSQASNDDIKLPPIINKVVPAEGPTSGGIEVSIYGQNFMPGMEVMFGDRAATATTYWGEKALCCVLPPATTTGPVLVSISGHNRGIPSHSLGAAFKYTSDNDDMRMMEMALRFYSLKMTGNEENWQSAAQNAASLWLTTAQAQDAPGGPSMPGAFPGA